MQRALEAAHSVRGYTSPNPWVGAVVVREGAILSVGATAPPGGPHAEAAALDGIDAAGATIYVTLEPCAPFPGKRTKPCAQAIIDAGVSRVVIALEDPDPNIRGRGIQLLREAGVGVEVGDGAGIARDSLRPYFKHREAGRPYLMAKFAASMDGRSATASGESQWITGPRARDRVHTERAWVDAVMVGAGTILADDPSLTARPGGNAANRQPARIVVDARGHIPANAHTLTLPGHVIVATSALAADDWKRELVAAGATIIECETDERGVNLDQLFRILAARNIMSVWLEGGPSLLGSVLDGQHADELWAFLAPAVLGSGARPAIEGVTALSMDTALRLNDVVIEPLHPDVLIRGYTGTWQPAE